jgi:hypothetical protein
MKQEIDLETALFKLREVMKQRNFLFSALVGFRNDLAKGRTINGRLAGTIDDISGDIQAFDFDLDNNFGVLEPWTPEEDAPPWE